MHLTTVLAALAALGYTSVTVLADPTRNAHEIFARDELLDLSVRDFLGVMYGRDLGLSRNGFEKRGPKGGPIVEGGWGGMGGASRPSGSGTTTASRSGDYVLGAGGKKCYCYLGPLLKSFTISTVTVLTSLIVLAMRFSTVFAVIATLGSTSVLAVTVVTSAGDVHELFARDGLHDLDTRDDTGALYARRDLQLRGNLQRRMKPQNTVHPYVPPSEPARPVDSNGQRIYMPYRPPKDDPSSTVSGSPAVTGGRRVDNDELHTTAPTGGGKVNVDELPSYLSPPKPPAQNLKNPSEG
ncbi:hypothetical protein EIP91_011626 [Steccherinum ochraceum]|uniref:Uncharacterized protein n=1 Tax=Steccherinum ochraceum TaxID=92696 RepID=A0A4R0RPF6_9APHY|nr:hypothetical protein EIP91_011626 [Steccherinum ochraceum]